MNVALFVPHEGCPQQCSFCNQRGISGKSKKLTVRDIDEAVQTACRYPSVKKPLKREIAFFGGSFTAIERGYMLELLRAASRYIDGGHFTGIRISTRPDAIDNEICDILNTYGVTAVELGAQSMDDRVLLLNRRGHTAKDVQEASALIINSGFELGLQMMTGLYGSSPDESRETARKLIEISPKTVRIYPTVVLHGTPLAGLLQSGEYQPQPLREAVLLCSELLELFEEAGIDVIRLGLHSGGDIEENYLAGPYHPAFRELCESEIYLRRAKQALAAAGITGGKAELHIPVNAVSTMIGQKKANLSALHHDGFECRVIPDTALRKYEVIAKAGNKQ